MGKFYQKNAIYHFKESPFVKLMIHYPLKQRIHLVNMIFLQGSKPFGEYLCKFGTKHCEACFPVWACPLKSNCYFSWFCT